MGRSFKNRQDQMVAKSDKWINSIPKFKPIGAKQKEYVAALDDSEEVYCFGPPGTGKTYVAAAKAAEDWFDEYIDKIVITRPHVAAGGEDLGFLKGDMREKTEPWAQPVLNVLRHYMGDGRVETMLMSGAIEVAPLGLLRGASYTSTFLILDEAQNVSYEQIKMFLTRVGEDCTVVVCGDLDQSDLHALGVDSGLKVCLDIIAERGDGDGAISVVEFSFDDNVRGGPSRRWSRWFYEHEKAERNKRTPQPWGFLQ